MNKYNGFSNYETWLLNVWLTNDENWYESTIERIKDSSVSEIAREIKEEFVDLVNETYSGFFLDLITYGLDQIDFKEVMEDLIAD